MLENDQNPFENAEFAPESALAANAFASSLTDAELMLRAAEELEQTADMLLSFRDGARLMRSQAHALRKLARSR